jgi:hypothetical protein
MTTPAQDVLPSDKGCVQKCHTLFLSKFHLPIGGLMQSILTEFAEMDDINTGPIN